MQKGAASKLNEKASDLIKLLEGMILDPGTHQDPLRRKSSSNPVQEIRITWCVYSEFDFSNITCQRAPRTPRKYVSDDSEESLEQSLEDVCSSDEQSILEAFLKEEASACSDGASNSSEEGDSTADEALLSGLQALSLTSEDRGILPISPGYQQSAGSETNMSEGALTPQKKRRSCCRFQ